jgi:hypothetical protein
MDENEKEKQAFKANQPKILPMTVAARAKA